MNLTPMSILPPRSAQLVERLKRKTKNNRLSTSRRDETQNLDPFIDHLGPSGFQQRYY